MEVNKNWSMMCQGIFSVLLGLAGMLSLAFLPSAQRLDIHAIYEVDLVSWKCAAIFVVLTAVFYYLVGKLWKRADGISVISDGENDREKVFKRAMTMTIGVWAVWFIVYFPGAGMNDTINMIMSPTDSSMQPLIYMAVIYYVFHCLGWFTGSMTAAYAIVVIAQMLLMAFSVAATLSWLSQKHVRSGIIKALTIYYACFPVFGDYAITLVKDTAFSLLIMILVFMMYDVAGSKGEVLRDRKYFVGFLLVDLGIVGCRTNGLFVVGISLLTLVFCVKRKKELLAAACAVVVLVAATTAVENNVYKVNERFREATGVPMVQIAAVLNDDQGTIAEEEKELFNGILPLEAWKENYRYTLTDRIKFNAQFNTAFLNEHKADFIAAWAKTLPANFKTYVKSYLAHSYGLWTLSPLCVTRSDFTQSIFKKINNNTAADSRWGTYCDSVGLKNIQLLPDSIQKAFDAAMTAFLKLSLILTPSIQMWGILCCIAFSLSKKRTTVLICCIPLLAVWLSMLISAPASLTYRYSLYITQALPVVIVLTLLDRCQTAGSAPAEQAGSN